MMTLLATTKIVSGIPLNHLAIAISVTTFLFVLPALFDPQKFREAMIEFFSASNALIRTAGVFHLLFAFLILNSRYTLQYHVRSLVPLVGYLVLGRGIIWLWFPGFVKRIARRFLEKDWMLYLMALVGILFALGFGYLGFWQKL